jgi:hypothetical protein
MHRVADSVNGILDPMLAINMSLMVTKLREIYTFTRMMLVLVHCEHSALWRQDNLASGNV